MLPSRLRNLQGRDGAWRAFFDESDIERSLLEQFRDIGYETATGAEISPDGERPERQSYGDVVLRERLRTALVKINAHLSAGAVEETLRKVERSEAPGLVESNRRFHKMLAEGVTVELQRPARAGGGISYETVQLVDFEHPEENDFLAVSQLRVTEGRKKRRLDVVVFVNGLPLAVFEIKNPVDEKATVKSAFDQLQTYKEEFPTLFGFNEVLVATRICG